MGNNEKTVGAERFFREVEGRLVSRALEFTPRIASGGIRCHR